MLQEGNKMLDPVLLPLNYLMGLWFVTPTDPITIVNNYSQ